LLTAHFLQRWRQGDIQPAAWLVHAGLACWAMVGIGLSIGLLVAAGTIDVSLLSNWRWPSLQQGAWLGFLPVFGALAAWLCWRRQLRTGVISSVALTAVLFVGALAFWAGPALDAYKAPRFLVETAGARQLYSDVRIGCYEYYQPSLVFYCQRKVNRLSNERQALEFLQTPLPVYLFLPASVWNELEAKVSGPHRLLSRQKCLYANCEVVVVTNQTNR
jgi:hypothetical protein